LKRGESGDQTARARLKRHAIAIDAEIERQAIGNDHQSSPAQVWTTRVLLRRTFSHEVNLRPSPRTNEKKFLPLKMILLLFTCSVRALISARSRPTHSLFVIVIEEQLEERRQQQTYLSTIITFDVGMSALALQ
jgi:hypothetical protein